MGLLLPEQPSDLAQMVHARTQALAQVTLPGLLKKCFTHGLRLSEDKLCLGLCHQPVGSCGGLPLAVMQLCWPCSTTFAQGGSCAMSLDTSCLLEKKLGLLRV